MEQFEKHFTALSLALLLILGVTVFERADTIAQFLERDDALAAVINPVSAFLGVSDTQGSYTSTAEVAAQATPEEATTLWGRISSILSTPTTANNASSSTYTQVSERTPLLLCVPSAASKDETVMLFWACRDGANRTESTGFDTDGEVVGSTRIHPSETDEYTVDCLTDTEDSFTSTTASCTVRVVDPTLTLTATPSEVVAGTSVVVSWVTSEVRSCALTSDTDGAINRTGISGETRYTVTQDTTFTLTCEDATGMEVVTTRDVTVQ